VRRNVAPRIYGIFGTPQRTPCKSALDLRVHGTGRFLEKKLFALIVPFVPEGKKRVSPPVGGEVDDKKAFPAAPIFLGTDRNGANFF